MLISDWSSDGCTSDRRPGAVTFATNMAGRGTDIVLGGSLHAELADLEAETGEPVGEVNRARLKAEWQKRHDAVKEAGGLHIVGRSEDRRVGKACVSTCSSRLSPYHYTKKTITTTNIPNVI